MKNWKFEALHITISNIANEQPYATAIETENKCMTYKELECRSNGIANYLHHQVPGYQQKFIIFMESSPNYIATIIATLKLGSIFIPIDKNLPIERIRILLGEVNADAFITTNEYYKKLQSIIGAENKKKPIFLVDNESAKNMQTNLYQYNYRLDTNILSFEQRTEKNAYIFFTSGSTGKPKAVLGRHRSLAHFINWEISQFKLNSKVKVCQLTNLSFDPSLRDIFVPLLTGGTCCIINHDTRLDMTRLIDYIEEKSISLIHIVPTLFKSMISKLNSQNKVKLASVKNILLAGELLHGADVLPFYNLYNNEIQLVNLYGPTETTLAKFFHLILPGEASKPIIPIGKPIAGTEGLLLDDERNLCKPGEKGVLYIRTPYISSGYLNAEAATSASFIKNPFNDNPNDIIYKTGDVAKMLPDGNIELLGRCDNQVKIRGNRIELGEIENKLLSFSDIKEAVLTVISEKENQYLCAYFTATKDVDNKSLRQFMAASLPDYMLPTYFTQLDSMPLNTNGKVDRSKLPAPKRCPKNIIYPKNKFEEAILEIWSDILEIEKSALSTDDNFFEVGGHSLKAMMVVTSINTIFNASITIKDFFENSVLSNLSDLVSIKCTQNRSLRINKSEPLELYPLTPSQKGIYFAQQLSPSIPNYNISHAFIVNGNLDKKLLSYSLLTLLNKHDVLRTFIEFENNQPMQKVKDAKVDLAELDLEFSGSMNCNIELAIKSHAHRVFNLTTEGPIRFQLIKIAENKFIFQITVHHIAVDAWALDIILKDIWNFYKLGKKEHLKDAKQLQYMDYAVFSSTNDFKSNLERHKTFWIDKLKNQEVKVELEPDYSRTSQPTFIGGNVDAVINVELVKKLSSISHENQSTIFMTLFAAFNVLLYKYTGIENIVVGTPVAGRNNIDLINMVGNFVNLLPLKTLVRNNLRFSDLLKAVKKEALEAYEYQDYPYENIIRDLSLYSHTSREGLFSIVFSMQNTNNEQLLPGSNFVVSDLRLDKYPIQQSYNKFDLTVTLTPNASEIHVNFHFAKDLFKTCKIERMKSHFLHILNQICDDPNIMVSQLELLEKFALEMLNSDSRSKKAIFPKEKTIISIFEDIVKLYPQKTAVKMDDTILTYEELNAKVNKLASYMVANGLKQKGLVAILLDRSINQIISLLAVLKTGNAYLPLDPKHPDSRLRWIMEDSKAHYLITESKLADRIKRNAGFIFLDRHNFLNENAGNLNICCQPNDLAYVIYTSGTTGKPKGVLVEHKNIVQLFFHTPNLFRFSEQDTWTMFHSYCFDFSVWEMYGSLLYGATLILISDEQAKDPSEFLKVIKDNSVTVLNQTPTAFYNLIKEDSRIQQNDLSLRYVIFGGEALQQSKIKQWRQKYPLVKLINMYGITETTIHVTYKEITDDDIDQGISNIGKPLPTYKCFIVNKDLNILPPGIAGELLIGGQGLTRGYLNRKELTKDKFIHSPFDQGELLYRSGDLAKYLENGEIQYLGRIDSQVQLSGFRIELGEIENVLIHHPDVRDVKVLIKESEKLGKYICAFIVSSIEIPSAALRVYISNRLPYYMVPNYIIRVNSFSQTINGKIDISSLPDPLTSINTGTKKVSPRNSLEKKIIDAWQIALSVKEISVRDNFFDLGGNSLLALSSVLAANREYTLADLFKYPVVEDLALHIQNSKNTGFLTLLGESSKNDDSISFIGIPYGGGDAADYKQLAIEIDKINKNILVYAVEIPGHDLTRNSGELYSTKELAKLIANQLIADAHKKVILYGHCVGSALAIAIATELRSSKIDILAIYVAAVFPPQFMSLDKPILDPWASATNEQIITTLRELGWSQISINADIVDAIIKNFRYDVKNFREYFFAFKARQKLNIPIYNLIGSNDSSTIDYKIRSCEWLSYTENLQTILIEGADHYFIKNKCRHLAELIINITLDKVNDKIDLGESSSEHSF